MVFQLLKTKSKKYRPTNIVESVCSVISIELDGNIIVILSYSTILYKGINTSVYLRLCTLCMCEFSEAQ